MSTRSDQIKVSGRVKAIEDEIRLCNDPYEHIKRLIRKTLNNPVTFIKHDNALLPEGTIYFSYHSDNSSRFDCYLSLKEKL